jgi:HSP20 family molecular chaperone IbpA
VNVEEASASYQRGLLRIVLPVAERPPAPVRVSIEVLRAR